MNSTPTTPASTEPARLTDLTQLEVIESLTGYDELAIKNKFGAPIGNLFDEAISTARRSLAFVLYTRQENGPKDAYKAAMNLTVAQLDHIFASADDDDEPAAPGEPLSEAGKDEPQHETPPTSSPTSAS